MQGLWICSCSCLLFLSQKIVYMSPPWALLIDLRVIYPRCSRFSLSLPLGRAEWHPSSKCETPTRYSISSGRSEASRITAMAATMRAEQRAARVQGRQQLPDFALQLVFARLPLEDQVFTVSELGRVWRRWAQPKQLELQGQRQHLEEGSGDYYTSWVSAYAVPLWLVQEAWPALEREQHWRLFLRAARHGDVSALQWMWAQRRTRQQPFHDPYRSSSAQQRVHASLAAAAVGHLQVLQYLQALQPPCGWSSDVDRAAAVCKAAAGCGHLAVLQWLRAQNPPCPWQETDMCAAAAKFGHLEVLQWLRAAGPPCLWDVRTCVAAAQGGHVAVLQWLQAQVPPCPWNADVCKYAATAGRLTVLQWLRAQAPPCSWDVRTCVAAAQGGHLTVLQWLRAQDPPCPWDAGVCTWAARNGNLAILQWLRAQAPPCPWNAGVCRFYATGAVRDWFNQLG